MDSCKPLYRVSVSSSGLIFAMIVGAWAAYLVPMWLRRQDELNEARPTERFSTAIRLLSGRAAQERRAARRAAEGDASGARDADVRAYAEPVTTVAEPPAEPAAPEPEAEPEPEPVTAARAKVLARRRRTTMVLFVTFAGSGIFALSAGGGSLWIPAVPGLLLSVYIINVRARERRRYAVAMDRRRAEDAARRLRDRTHANAAARPEQPSRAVVEQTDHAEWVDQQRRRGPAAEDEPAGWEPAPVPLPTYVSAPVAPRTTRGVDLDAPGTWSAARSTPAQQPPPPAQQPPQAAPGQPGPQRTPLFDQFEEEDHRRAAGE
ncbi:hypothetical protein ACFV5N_12935 [Streptomyces sp. NPDC059853]|uniref:divisome protein SepX/GlpR n=1 Tax=Streptomyces sp. NPDC059853 TaxID=3346973 RepID=UPI0036624DC1